MSFLKQMRIICNCLIPAVSEDSKMIERFAILAAGPPPFPKRAKEATPTFLDSLSARRMHLARK